MLISLKIIDGNKIRRHKAVKIYRITKLQKDWGILKDFELDHVTGSLSYALKNWGHKEKLTEVLRAILQIVFKVSKHLTGM